MGVPLDKGRGVNSSSSSRVVVEAEDSSSKLVEAEGGSNFRVGLGFEWEAVNVCISWSVRRIERTWEVYSLRRMDTISFL